MATLDIIGDNVSILPKSSVTVTRNVTISPGVRTSLIVNLTVTRQTGEPDRLRFQLFSGNSSVSCQNTQQESFLLNQEVANESLTVPMTTSGTLCFVFNNLDSGTGKLVNVFGTLDMRSEKVVVARDGGANLAGLGLGAVGFLVVAYGFARKTIIPWE